VTTDAKILSALRENPDGVSGAELAEQLGISRAAVWARIEELRSLGFDISRPSPHFGYRIVSANRTRCTRMICSRAWAKQKSSGATSACLSKPLPQMT
jgi:biotin operon repressor BirA-like protein